MPQSVQDCWDIADASAATQFGQRWMQIFGACKDDLCQKHLISCDE